MVPTPKQCLDYLPKYVDKWQVITDKQYVPDIINDIIVCHRLFGKYYDCFAQLFFQGSGAQICDTLYDFCKKYIRYKEETKEMQTTGVPQGILTRRVGDCKHYALFCAGVIDALNRRYGLGLKWWYYFAGYTPKCKTPYHVYVCVMDGDTELWLDPTPGSGGEPTLLVKQVVHG